MRRVTLTVLALAMLQACTVQEFKNDRKPDPVAGARARVAIAAEYLQKNQSEQALPYLQKALELDPKSAEAHNVMGALLEKEGDLAKAEQHYLKALGLKGDYAQAHNNYGVLLYRQKRYKDAMEQFSLAAADLGYERRDVALVYVGDIALRLGDKAKAKASFERAFRVNPRQPQPALELASLALEGQDLDMAGRYYKQYLRALATEPQSARGLWLGIRLARATQDNDALASYELALKRLYRDSEEYRAYLQSLNGS